MVTKEVAHCASADCGVKRGESGGLTWVGWQARVAAMKFAALMSVLVVGLCSCTVPMTPLAGRGTPHPLGHGAGPQGFRTVVIDAGHGGKDSGAVSPHTGQMEKNLALDTARRLRAALGGQFRVVMMRDEDVFVELDERVARASQYGDAILLSIHYNSGPGHLHGPESFYWRVDSHGLAVRAQQALVAAAGTGNSRGLVRRRIRLTRNPTIPCLLVECGYLSNAAEARRCSDPSYRQRIAENLAQALRTQAAVGDAGTGPLPPPLNEPPSRPTDPRQ